MADFGPCPEGRGCRPVVTPEMIQAGMIAARRGGLGPVATYAQFQRFKSGLIAAYRAMRAFEQDELRENDEAKVREAHWGVTVWRNGEPVVTIETNSLSGREIDRADEEAIRTAALHLLSFIGDHPW